ncbi:tetratricopeptide repeat protein [Caulobacter sp. NIBR2454]|uniref:tetratricopeptide repeat protein n=1 Tax=Caulobacter sp. NIBR2454 TaxID=3015996 RepID=UPI0022B6E269|nr:tetratricopeptide repeat protein [Caulobacter sp. NIBR2454]
MKLLPRLVALAPLAFAAACAGAPKAAPEPNAFADSDVIVSSVARSSTPYGLFLAGQAAMNDGDSRQAAELFGRADQLGGDATVKDRAFTAALLSGEVRRAAMLAPTDEATDNQAVYRLGQLVTAVEDLASGRAKQAQAALTGGRITFPHAGAAALLAPWAAAAAGDKNGAVIRPEVRGDRVVQVFGMLGQAHLYERAGRYDEAETDFKALTGDAQTGSLFSLDYGNFLERRGRKQDAATVYRDALAVRSNDAGLRAALARVEAGRAAPPPPTIKQGAAQSLIAASAVYMGERQRQIALAYLRLALRLDDQRDEAWVMLGDLLALAGDAQAARETYQRVGPKSPLYASARGKLAWTYQTEGDKETALRLVREAALAAPLEADRQIAWAEMLRANDRWAESVEVLNPVIARQGENADWRLLYMRGVSLERSGNWPEAQKDLEKALARQPDEPELLNYLGYSWIDRGERLPEAMAMVKKAVLANPRSGAMLDSLGWAQYRLGDYKAAVETLERAVVLEPADPDVNNHLGDAYWRVGRRTEATFQWTRVLSLEPSDVLRSEAEAKLKNGLGAKGPAAAPSVAER